MIKNIQSSIDKLKKRKNITTIAVKKLISLVKELENYLDEDITTEETETKVMMEIASLKYSNFYQHYSWKNYQGNFSLRIVNGKIKIAKIFKVESEECYGLKEYKDMGISSLHLSDETEEKDEVIKFDFKAFTIAIEELMQKAEKESSNMDKDALAFINFCNEWYESAA